MGVTPVSGDAFEYTFDGMSFERESRVPRAWNPCVQIFGGGTRALALSILSDSKELLIGGIGLVYCICLHFNPVFPRNSPWYNLK